jgi:hypothetical protein
MTRVCRDCGNSFEGEHWMTRCITCFIEHKRHERRESDLETAYREGYVDGLRDASPALEPDLLRDLIALCHPDRHPEARFELANRVTARLVRMRDQLREAA